MDVGSRRPHAQRSSVFEFTAPQSNVSTNINRGDVVGSSSTNNNIRENAYGESLSVGGGFWGEGAGTGAAASMLQQVSWSIQDTGCLPHNRSGN